MSSLFKVAKNDSAAALPQQTPVHPIDYRILHSAHTFANSVMCIVLETTVGMNDDPGPDTVPATADRGM